MGITLWAAFSAYLTICLALIDFGLRAALAGLED
jgi:hypothetical protein